MSEVNQGKGQVMGSQAINIFPLEANQETLEFVAPGKASLRHKALLVGHSIKPALRPTLGPFPSALILLDVRNQPMIEAGFTRSFGIKSGIRMEHSTLDTQAQTLQRPEGVLQSGLDLKGIVMMTRAQAQATDDVTFGLIEREQVAGLGFLAGLIGYSGPAFFRQGVTAVETHCRQIQLALHLNNAGLPDFLQAAIAAPLAKMVVDGVIANLLFVCMQGIRGNRQLPPLAAGMQPIKDVIENLVQWYLAHKASLCRAQMRQKVALELVLSYFSRYGAHSCGPSGKLAYGYDAPF